MGGEEENMTDTQQPVYLPTVFLAEPTPDNRDPILTKGLRESSMVVVCVWGRWGGEVSPEKMFYPDRMIDDLQKELYPFGVLYFYMKK